MLTRRSLGSLLAAATVATSGMVAADTGAEAKKPERPRTYVLIHGAGAGEWCWRLVAPMLREKGHTVYAPSLTGAADRFHLLRPETNLDSQIDDVIALMKWEDLNDVILVGHSYGGMVITGVADRALERIAQIVYLDAAQPVNGESLADVAPDTVALGKRTLRTVNGAQVIGSPSFEENGYAQARALPPIGTDAAAMQVWHDSHSTPVAWNTITQKLVLRNEEAVHRLPRTSVNTTQSLKRKAQSEAADRRLHADRVWTVDTSHNLMLTEPRITADMLLRLAPL